MNPSNSIVEDFLELSSCDAYRAFVGNIGIELLVDMFDEFCSDLKITRVVARESAFYLCNSIKRKASGSGGAVVAVIVTAFSVVIGAVVLVERELVLVVVVEVRVQVQE